MRRIPNSDDGIMELMVSVVVDEAVQGVMGGGDSGVAGESGHLNLGLRGLNAEPDPGDSTPICGESIVRTGEGPL